jgi:hypothetical protein
MPVLNRRPAGQKTRAVINPADECLVESFRWIKNWVKYPSRKDLRGRLEATLADSRVREIAIRRLLWQRIQRELKKHERDLNLEPNDYARFQEQILPSA